MDFELSRMIEQNGAQEVEINKLRKEVETLRAALAKALAQDSDPVDEIDDNVGC